MVYSVQAIETDILVSERVQVRLHHYAAHLAFARSYREQFPVALADPEPLSRLHQRLRQVLGETPYELVNPTNPSCKVNDAGSIGALRLHFRISERPAPKRSWFAGLFDFGRA